MTATCRTPTSVDIKQFTLLKVIHQSPTYHEKVRSNLFRPAMRIYHLTPFALLKNLPQEFSITT